MFTQRTGPYRAGRGRRATAALALLMLMAGGVAACSSPDGPEATLDAFLTGWREGNLDKVGFIGADGSTFPAQQVLAAIKGLSAKVAERPSALRAQDGDPKMTGNIATMAITVSWALPGGTTWSYPSAVRLAEGKQGWQVIWEPTIVHEQLTDGDELTVRRLPSSRAGVLDNAGRALIAPRPVVAIGVTPQRITALPALTKSLDEAFRSIDVSVDLKDLPARVAKAGPGAFIELVTLRRSDYDKIRSRVRPLEGTVFRSEERDLAPTRQFARALLGTVDPATLDDLSERPDALVTGDLVGHGGLQERYDAQLRGRAGQSVVIARKAPDGTVEDTVLYRTEPQAGSPVKTTLNVATQTAADRALAGEKQRSSLVAVRVTDGSILAVANGPDGGGADLALTAQVPPGSTFKMVSALGLLEKKAVTIDGTVSCPRSTTVDGAQFRNAHGFALGRVPFRTVFAKSCNTAFAELAPKLGADGLAGTAAELGLGVPWDLGVEAFTGKVSTGGSPAERAAAAFGQGTTQVSPVAMAGATAAIAKGSFQQPRLVLEPAPAHPAATRAALDAGSVEAIRTMMREVVTRGTGTALRDVPGAPVSGKTGTAEFSTGSKETHAWFIGWQGDIAFAVLVETGGAGADRRALPAQPRPRLNTKHRSRPLRAGAAGHGWSAGLTSPASNAGRCTGRVNASTGRGRSRPGALDGRRSVPTSAGPESTRTGRASSAPSGDRATDRSLTDGNAAAGGPGSLAGSADLSGSGLAVRRSEPLRCAPFGAVRGASVERTGARPATIAAVISSAYEPSGS
jgi:cell division protein FtsI/penicillin-binding protein 2